MKLLRNQTFFYDFKGDSGELIPLKLLNNKREIWQRSLNNNGTRLTSMDFSLTTEESSQKSLA